MTRHRSLLRRVVDTTGILVQIGMVLLAWAVTIVLEVLVAPFTIAGRLWDWVTSTSLMPLPVLARGPGRSHV